MARKQNYGVFFTPLMVLVFMVLAIAIPALLVGGAVFVKAVQLLFFSKIASGSIPIWAIIVIGMAIMIIIKRR